MKNIYIFRHGQTDYNLEKRVLGQTSDIPLNQTGIDQANELANNMASVDLNVVIASPLKRALATGEIVAKSKNIPIIVEKDLIEICFGNVEGKLWSEIPENEVVRFRDLSDLDFCWLGGTSRRDANVRAFNVMKKIADMPYYNIGIATHGGLIINFLSNLGLSEGFGVPHGEPFHLTYDNGKFNLIQGFAKIPV
jgi:broad specificity phosphatase PhoE